MKINSINAGNFVKWNEGMSIKHNPDKHHNHPNPIMRFLERRRTGTIIKYLDVRESDFVLDVGCGAGNMLEQIRKGRLFGIDISQFVLGLSRERLGNQTILLRGNAESLPFRDNHFDRIFCSEVIEHTLSPDNVIREIFRVLRPDGICVLSIPNENFSIKLKEFIKSSGIARLLLPADRGEASRLYSIHEWHLHAFSLNLLRKIIQGRFRITAHMGIPFGIIPVKYVVCLRKVMKCVRL